MKDQIEAFLEAKNTDYGYATHSSIAELLEEFILQIPETKHVIVLPTSYSVFELRLSDGRIGKLEFELGKDKKFTQRPGYLYTAALHSPHAARRFAEMLIKQGNKK